MKPKQSAKNGWGVTAYFPLTLFHCYSLRLETCEMAPQPQGR